MPINARDLVHIAALTQERTAGNGDVYYAAAAQVEDQVNPTEQEYFYRAMQRDEAEGWLATPCNPKIQTTDHQGWSSYRRYSLAYLNEGTGYRYLLEAHAPGFVEKMRALGVKSGKAESGDISWGVGGANSNSFGSAGKQANKELLRRYKEYFPDGKLALNQARKITVELAPRIFLDCLTSVRVVNLRSSPDGA